MIRSPLLLAGVAALMGAAGVALAAAGVHASGGELALRGTEFLILHACAALAIAAMSARALVWVGFAMEAGASLFSGELAVRAFTGERIFPFAAPIGGSTMILSWVALAIVFAVAARRGR